MNPAIEDDDADWDREPTALEAAHYNAMLDRAAQQASERARAIFGTCLLQLTKLGMKEGHARSMLGKWRGAAKDDALLIRTVKAAYDNGTPDPVSYITKAIAAAKQRSSRITNLQRSEWTLIGWEAPKLVAGQPRFKNGARGQVWRDPFGKMTVLPAADNVTPPSLDEDPGYQMDKAA
jgi:hypothetical protein